MKATGINRMQNKTTVNTMESNDAVVDFNDEPESIVNKPTSGIVVGCEFLNVRKSSTKDSETLAVIKSGDKITVDTNMSTNDFYKIHTLSGIDGFCMKKFIEVQ